MLRYAVKKGILPKETNPQRGAGKLSIAAYIKKDFDRLTNEEIEQTLLDIGSDYVQTRQASEQEWENWVEQQSEQLQLQDETVEQIEEERKESGEDPVAERRAKEDAQRQKLAEAEQELINDVKEILTPQTEGGN